jgi:hypothetical protein
MKAALLLSTSMLIVLASSCHKSAKSNSSGNINPFHCTKYYTFTGKVRDSLTGTPLTGVIVGYDAPIPHWLDTSNADGSYTVSYEYNPCSKYPSISSDPIYYLNAHGDYYYSKEIGVADDSSGTIFHEDIYAVPFSHLTIHVTGTTGGETLSIDGFQPYPEQKVTLGSIVDTLITRKISSNRTTSCHLYVDDILYSTTPYQSGYGTTGTLDIHYP